jgi:endonuclease/exonuclease/phosphatase family metal-dependent hydrolase
VVFPTDGAPGAAETVSVGGEPVRVWDVHLDEADYGPYAACFAGATASQLVSDEKATTRYAQAQAVARAMADDLRAGTPVVLLGDLASPANTDWTAGTSASHCGVGAVDWPVPEVFTRTGLADSYRAAYPDPRANPGTTWSPLVRTNADGKPEPQDRVDYVDYTPAGLSLTSSDTMWLGWPSEADPSGNSWASDHAAVLSRFVVDGTHHGH